MRGYDLGLPFHTISEVHLLVYIKIYQQSEPISYPEDLVRIIVVWCRRRDSNPHSQRPGDFKSPASAIPPLRQQEHYNSLRVMPQWF